MLNHALWSSLFNYRGPVYLVMLSEFAAYLDDSGHPDDEDVVLVAGLVAEKKKWLQFEPEWIKALRPLEWFHATDFVRASKDWTDRDRKKYLNRLVHVIESHAVFSVSDSVGMDDYRRVNGTYRLEEALGAPYALTGRTVSGILRAWQRSHGGDDCKMLIYFDDGSKHKGDLMAVVQRDAFPCPGFLRKKDVPALQAADFLAWLLFKGIQTGIVSPQLDRLVKIGDPTSHRKHSRQNLIDSVMKIPANVPMVRSGALPMVDIRFHSEPKRPRQRTIKDQ